VGSNPTLPAIEVHMSVVDFSLPNPKTEFAPIYKMYGWSCKFDNDDAIDDMRDWIIKNEKRIIEETPDNPFDDAGTGLGKNSLTAKYVFFNLMEETRDVESFKLYRKWLWNQYQEFMSTIRYPVRDCYINAWANVVRKSQAMGLHHHGVKPFSYLSANMHLDDYETETYYINSIDHKKYSFKNVKGGCVFFPSSMRHGVTKHKKQNRRVSIAFDLYDKVVSENPNEYYPLVDFRYEE